MRISSIEVRLLDLPLTEPFAASHGTTTSRTVSVVKLTADGATGWGECSALPAATYTAESAVGSYEALAEQMAPAIVGTEIALDRTELSQGGLERLAAAGPDLPMARSAIEMAMVDAALTTSGQSLASWLAASSTVGTGQADAGAVSVPAAVTAGVSVGLDSIDRTVARCLDLAQDGYRRLKVKIQPRHDVELVESIRAALPTVELQVDANGAYRQQVDHILDVINAGANVVEQPFAIDDQASARELITRLDARGSAVPVVADEAVQRFEQAETLITGRAMTGLSIKPARVGGLETAVRLHDLCHSAGIGATAGGMLETGLGRHALVALAALPGFAITGDLSPAGRWLAVDPWPELIMSDGRLTVPVGPGIAPEPDPGLIDDHTKHRTLLSG